MRPIVLTREKLHSLQQPVPIGATQEKQGCGAPVRSSSAVVAEQQHYRAAAAAAESSHAILVHAGVDNVVHIWDCFIRTKGIKYTLSQALARPAFE